MLTNWLLIKKPSVAKSIPCFSISRLANVEDFFNANVANVEDFFKCKCMRINDYSFKLCLCILICIHVYTSV